MGRRSAVLTAIAAVAIPAIAAPGADAASVKAGGQVIAPPASYKGKLAVPVLLSQSSQKALRTNSPVARLLVGKNERVPGPGNARIAASDVKAGDDVSAKVTRAKKQSSIPSFSARGLSVSKRQGNLSNSELQAAVYELARSYFNSSAAQDSKLSSLEGRLAKLESGATQSAITGLQNDVNNLTTTVNGLTSQLGSLNSLVTTICHVPVVDLVVACP